MKPDLETQSRIRRYLLGEADEAEREAIETLILTDDEFFEELQVVEDEVIDAYLNEKLSPKARSNFEKYFLASPERSEQLQFARVFDRYVSSQTVAAPPELKAATSPPGWFYSFYSSPAKVAVFAIFLIVIGLGAWQIFFRQSNVDKGLIALNAAYRE